MEISILRKRMSAAPAVVAFLILAAPGANAQCGAARNGGMSVPGLESLQDSAVFGQKSLSEPAASSQTQEQHERRSHVSIVGFWKTIAFASGVLNDVGFEQFAPGGTELLNDTGVPGGGNSFCMGAWKRIGPLTYSLVHPFFVLDPSDGKTPIAIGIERARMTVAPDGNTFSGTWTQDNYDFSGHVVAGGHYDGTLTGTRIAPGRRFPFPFPL
jgi:hypothetical protein